MIISFNQSKNLGQLLLQFSNEHFDLEILSKVKKKSSSKFLQIYGLTDKYLPVIHSTPSTCAIMWHVWFQLVFGSFIVCNDIIISDYSLPIWQWIRKWTRKIKLHNWVFRLIEFPKLSSLFKTSIIKLAKSERSFSLSVVF